MSSPLNIAFIQASWHKEIVKQAREGFELQMKAEVQDFSLYDVSVPGGYEMPLMAQKLAQTGRFDAIVAAAFVVDGGIYRHDFVASAVVDGLMRVGLDTNVPCFSVSLTPHHFHEHQEHFNYFSQHMIQKGKEAAQAVVMMCDALEKVNKI